MPARYCVGGRRVGQSSGAARISTPNAAWQQPTSSVELTKHDSLEVGPEERDVGIWEALVVVQAGKPAFSQSLPWTPHASPSVPHCAQNGKSRQDRSRRLPCCDATSRLRRCAPAKLFQTSTRRLIGHSAAILLNSFWLAKAVRVSCAAGAAAWAVMSVSIVNVVMVVLLGLKAPWRPRYRSSMADRGRQPDVVAFQTLRPQLVLLDRKS